MNGEAVTLLAPLIDEGAIRGGWIWKSSLYGSDLGFHFFYHDADNGEGGTNVPVIATAISALNG